MRRRLALGSLILSLSIPAFSQTATLEALFKTSNFTPVENALDPGKSRDPEALYLFSKIKEGVHKTEEAVALAEAAVKLNPYEAKYHLQLARVLSDKTNNVGMMKRMSLAGRIRSELETAVRLEPRNTDCLFGLMIFYQTAPGMLGGSKSKARHIAQEIARIDESMGYLAQAQLVRKSRADQIENLYLSAVKANPGNVDAILALANYYASNAQQRYGSAGQYAEQALRDLEVTLGELNFRAASR
ncbi:MAG TPA: hypothetical protein VG498_07785 [Terriglobales bacterium]|nr:hypothetical protein [Terriglobales bacterium]